jgi:UDP-3-O-[3-hydroxymyristoyl] glucosamine N-acyltransferase
LAFKLSEIAESIRGKVVGDDRIVIAGINSLQEASEGEISFFADARYKEALKTTKASAILVSQPNDLFQGPQVVVSNPALSYAKVAALFSQPLPRFPGSSPGAVIHETSSIGDDVSIYPLVYVGKETIIGSGVTLFPGVFIGDRVRIGHNTVIHPNVTVMHDCIIGNEVILHAGTIIGSDGFGFVRDRSENVKIPQLGIVQIDDRVEIGANNAIDRAALGKTWIKRGVKTDNLVQIGHNVIIGEDSIIVAQVGISGSTRIGRGVLIGGQVGIGDHIEIGDRVMIGSQSGVAKSIPSGQVVSGTPTMPHRLWLRTTSLIPRLPDFNDRLRQLEKKLKEMEERLRKKKDNA